MQFNVVLLHNCDIIHSAANSGNF